MLTPEIPGTLAVVIGTRFSQAVILDCPNSCQKPIQRIKSTTGMSLVPSNSIDRKMCKNVHRKSAAAG